MKSCLLLLGVALATAAATVSADDSALNLEIGDAARKGRTAPLVLDGVTATADDALLTPEQLAERLDGVRLVFVGESHTDFEFHRIQQRVIRALHERGRQVLVGLEMYPVTEQASLDRWNDEKGLGEQAFLDESHWYRNWGYHWNYYRDIFNYSRDNGIRMFGVNVPRDVVQTVRREGFESLPPERRALLPERIDTESAEHRRLFKAFFGGEDALHGAMSDEMFEGMFKAQCTWDAAMGWNAVKALEKHGGEKAIMVVLIGSGHVSYGLGAERQARLWFDGGIATLIPIPVQDDESHEQVTVRASYANFLWGVPPSTDPLYPTLGLSTPEQKRGERYNVIMVQKKSVAEAAGFKVGDELVSMDGTALDDKETFNRLMSEKRWGDAAVFQVKRGEATETLTAYFRRTLEEKKPGGGDTQ